jgi:ATP-dependent protease HslVU (ClpYQ) peptidase subunit
MTCIVGIRSDTGVYLASERGLSDDDVIVSMTAPKIRQNGMYIIGYADSPGTGQLLHWMTLPTPPKKNVEKFMRTTFISSIRKQLTESGVDLKESAHASFLVGVSDQLFFIDTQDWQVTECEYMAIGSGSSIAMGSLYTTSTWKSAEKRAYTAVSAAIELSPSCQGPIDILSI